MKHNQEHEQSQVDRRVGKPASHDIEKAKALWVDRAMRLSAGRKVTPEARLAHYRAQCQAQRLPPDACFYSTAFVLMGIAVDRMAGAPNDRSLESWHRYDHPRDEIPTDGELGQGPGESSSGRPIEDERTDREIIRATFREYGESYIAELFINDPEEFERRYKRGQKYLIRSAPHEHRWTLLDLFAFDGPIFLCRDCGERRTFKD